MYVGSIGGVPGSWHDTEMIGVCEFCDVGSHTERMAMLARTTLMTTGTGLPGVTTTGPSAPSSRCSDLRR